MNERKIRSKTLMKLHVMKVDIGVSDYMNDDIDLD